MTARARGAARTAAWVLGLAAVAVALTWPLAASPDRAPSVRDDYLQNLWNFWWVRTALFELHSNPFVTDHLHHPLGISLGRHTLSPVNSLLGALAGAVLGLHDAYKALLILHFALAAAAMAWLARDLTGSRGAAALAGLVYAFAPFQWHYLPEINVSTREFVPLAALFLLRTWREGGVRNGALAVLATALVAASHWYYLVYTALFGGLLLVGGRLWDGDTPWRTGARRLAAAGAGCAGAVLLVGAPLLADALGGEAGPRISRSLRANDLLGFPWDGSPDRVLLSWPTMWGWSGLLLLAAGWRSALRERFWLLVGGVFFVLSLGTSLRVAGADTGLPLPFAWIQDLPVLWMLGKPDRMFAMLQLVFAVLLAFAARDVAARIGRPRCRAWALSGFGAVAMLELAAVPVATFDVGCSPAVAAAAGSGAVLDLPPFPGGSYAQARYNLCQTVHERPIAQGYVTVLAVTPRHVAQSAEWLRRWKLLAQEGRAGPLAAGMRSRGFGAAVLHKTRPVRRERLFEERGPVWRPFATLSRPLLMARQLGTLVRVPLPAAELARARAGLEAELGPPVAEDDEVVVFRRPRATDQGSASSGLRYPRWRRRSSVSSAGSAIRGAYSMPWGSAAARRTSSAPSSGASRGRVSRGSPESS